MLLLVPLLLVLLSMVSPVHDRLSLGRVAFAARWSRRSSCSSRTTTTCTTCLLLYHQVHPSSTAGQGHEAIQGLMAGADITHPNITS